MFTINDILKVWQTSYDDKFCEHNNISLLSAGKKNKVFQGHFSSLEIATAWEFPMGGTDLEMGYVDVQPWRPPFHASPVVHKGPISRKRVSSQDPLFEKIWKF